MPSSSLASLLPNRSVQPLQQILQFSVFLKDGISQQPAVLAMAYPQEQNRRYYSASPPVGYD